MRSHSTNKRSPGKKRPREEAATGRLHDEDLEHVAGGIETVPLPEAKRTKKKKPAKKKMVAMDPDDGWV